jgi:hypothetical protein
MTKAPTRSIALVLLNILAALHTSASGQETKVKVPFLFTEDEQLQQTELEQVIPKSDELSKDSYLNAPLTRLDYFLINLEKRLDEGKAGILGRVIKHFATIERKALSDASIEAYARHDANRGRIIVGYTLIDLGRPTQPMQATCKAVLDDLQFLAPQKLTGYLYHNTLLGVLAQRRLDEYTPILGRVAKNIVHRVSLQSVTQDGRVVHTLMCQRTEDGGTIRYYRSSFRLQ